MNKKLFFITFVLSMQSVFSQQNALSLSFSPFIDFGFAKALNFLSSDFANYQDRKSTFEKAKKFYPANLYPININVSYTFLRKHNIDFNIGWFFKNYNDKPEDNKCKQKQVCKTDFAKKMFLPSANSDYSFDIKQYIFSKLFFVSLGYSYNFFNKTFGVFRLAIGASLSFDFGYTSYKKNTRNIYYRDENFYLSSYLFGFSIKLPISFNFLIVKRRNFITELYLSLNVGLSLYGILQKFRGSDKDAGLKKLGLQARLIEAKYFRIGIPINPQFGIRFWF